MAAVSRIAAGRTRHDASSRTLVALTSPCHEAEEEESDRPRQRGTARGAKVRFSAGGDTSDSG